MKRKVKISAKQKAEIQQLSNLVSVGEATLRDFQLLGIDSLEQLAASSPKELYEKLCKAKGMRLDPCCEDVFSAAVAQAKNPRLASEKKNWWYWSRNRKRQEAKSSRTSK